MSFDFADLTTGISSHADAVRSMRARVLEGKTSYADVVRDVRPGELRIQTEQFFDAVQSLVDEATDTAVLLVPIDHQASSEPETAWEIIAAREGRWVPDHENDWEGVKRGWTLPQVIAHVTAILEDGMACAAMLARGVQLVGRLISEVPWESMTTASQVQARVRESRRICLALLDAWPDQPHLETTVIRIPEIGPLNAIGIGMSGLFHGPMHLDQLREILRQAIDPANGEKGSI
jgi:hypothetical protein